MKLSTFKTILTEVEKIRPRTAVMYHGGEPFLNGNLLMMTELLKKKGIQYIKLNTNGSLLTRSILRRIALSKIDYLRFSVGGTSQEEYSQMCRGGNYQQLVATIKKLLDLKRAVGNTTLNVDVYNVQVLTEQELMQGKIQVASFLREEFEEYRGQVTLTASPAIVWPGYPLKNSSYRLAQLPRYKEPSNRCEHLYDRITIRYNGDVVPCCFDLASSHVLGNINDNSIEEIYNGEKFTAFRRSIEEREYPLLCQTCWLLGMEIYLTKQSRERRKWNEG